MKVKKVLPELAPICGQLWQLFKLFGLIARIVPSRKQMLIKGVTVRLNRLKAEPRLSIFS